MRSQWLEELYTHNNNLKRYTIINRPVCEQRPYSGMPCHSKIKIRMEQHFYECYTNSAIGTIMSTNTRGASSALDKNPETSVLGVQHPAV